VICRTYRETIPERLTERRLGGDVYLSIVRKTALGKLHFLREGPDWPVEGKSQDCRASSIVCCKGGGDEKELSSYVREGGRRVCGGVGGATAQEKGKKRRQGGDGTHQLLGRGCARWRYIAGNQGLALGIK